MAEASTKPRATGSLTALPALGGHDETFGEVRIEERTGLGIVGAAVPLGEEKPFAAALRKGYGLDLPEVGHSDEANGIRAAMLQPGQLWIIVPDGADDAFAAARAAFEEKAWLVDQSDAWAALRVSGSQAAVHRALERICMLDLATFADGAVTRTSMEHLGVVLLREGGAYTLMSARSSAMSLLHALTLSARHTND